MAEAAVEPIGWERALMAAEKVRERLHRATRALDAAGVQYAVAGGNAVAEWVGRVHEDAVRNTRDVDLLIRRSELPAVRTALKAAGFIDHYLLDIHTFIDGPQGKPSGGVHPSSRARRYGRNMNMCCPISTNRSAPPSSRWRVSKRSCA